MPYNKSTVGVLVYLYILFIATVGLLVLIQPSYCAEASDDQQNSVNEEKDDNYLQSPSLSYDFETMSETHVHEDTKIYQQTDQQRASPTQGQLHDKPEVSSNNLDSSVMEQQVPLEEEEKKREQVNQNSPQETGEYDAFVSPVHQQPQQQQQQQQTLSATSSGIKASIKVDCEPFLDDLDEEERKQEAAVRLVNSSQIFAYLDRIHGTVPDVNDTESKSSSSANNNSSNFTSSPNGTSERVDGSEKMTEKSEQVSTTSVQTGQSNHVISDNVTDNIINEKESLPPQLQILGAQGDEKRVDAGETTQHQVTVNASSQASHCALVLFYYPWCIFSAKAAPAFNAIGRIFPQIRVMALDAYTDTGLNMRFGLVGVPTILFFHNSKLIAKYNETDVTPEGLLSFIHKITGLTPVDAPLVTPSDLAGPVPTTPLKTIDYVALISWIFVSLCAAFFLVNSVAFSRLLEFVRNNWRDAQAAQHQHAD